MTPRNDSAVPIPGRLPAPRRPVCTALTVDGQRKEFDTPELLVRWAMRSRDVVAVCLDNCAWRDFGRFTHWLGSGLSPLEAFERTDLFIGGKPRPARKARFTQG